MSGRVQQFIVKGENIGDYTSASAKTARGGVYLDDCLFSVAVGYGIEGSSHAAFDSPLAG